MAKAASSLAITQSAISKTVAEMEHVLGVPLLDRTPRVVEVTAYGEILLRRALVVFDEIRQGVREIGFMADATTGQVRIGSTELMLVIIAAAIDLLSRRHPRISFEVSARDTTTLLWLMRERWILPPPHAFLRPYIEGDVPGRGRDNFRAETPANPLPTRL
jgi:DNA-binding transcriptional LysR family regulator